VAKRVLTVAACVLVLAVPSANAWAALHQRTSKLVTKKIVGPTIQCPPQKHNYGKWGPLQIAIKIQKVPGSKRFKILDVTWPVWPQHTAKSIYINQKALPLLRMEVLQLQSSKVESISGATNVTDSFVQSLDAALLAAAKA
jgi:uncharacterized protein with FMN-binding domain